MQFRKGPDNRSSLTVLAAHWRGVREVMSWGVKPGQWKQRLGWLRYRARMALSTAWAFRSDK